MTGTCTCSKETRMSRFNSWRAIVDEEGIHHKIRTTPQAKLPVVTDITAKV